MNRVSKRSAFFCVMFKWLVLFYPIYVTLDWMGFFPATSIYQLWGHPTPLNNIPMYLRVYAALIDMIPTAIISLSFYYLSKLFKLYEQGHFFTIDNINYIKKIGYTLCCHVVAWVLVQPLISYILTLGLGQNERIIMVSIQSAEIANFICGAIIILISSIMNEAKKNQDELALTV